MTTSTAEPVAQRKVPTDTSNPNTLLNSNTILERLTYGVPAPRRMLSPSLLLKKHHYVISYLKAIGLTPSEREITMHLLRLYAYYGKVYPKAQEFTEDGGCSKRSFWRAVAKLEDSGLIDRINRYLHHLQISNCYRLDKLILCVIRYLAEHGSPYLDAFTRQLLLDTSSHFWTLIHRIRLRLRDPNPLTTLA